MENYLSTIPGALGVPLSYVIREVEAPTPDGHDNFIEKSIACAPLKGPIFEADARRVHQVISSNVQGEIAEQWIDTKKRKQNGRLDMLTLRAHYSGEGNASRRIGEAERSRETLHYKNERSLSFGNYLGKVQKMFNIFSDQGEAYTEDMKLRFLFKTVQHASLSASVEALKVRDSIGETALTFTEAANHLAAQVSTMPEFVAKGRGISAIEIGSPGGGGKSSIHRSDGSIYTGFIKNWGSLSQDEKTKVIEERARLGIKGRDGASPKRKRYTSAVTAKRTIAKIQAELKATKRTVAALKRDADGVVSDEEKAPDDAGNSFGGRNQKKKSKSGD